MLQNAVQEPHLRLICGLNDRLRFSKLYLSFVSSWTACWRLLLLFVRGFHTEPELARMARARTWLNSSHSFCCWQRQSHAPSSASSDWSTVEFSVAAFGMVEPRTCGALGTADSSFAALSGCIRLEIQARPMNLKSSFMGHLGLWSLWFWLWRWRWKWRRWRRLEGSSSHCTLHFFACWTAAMLCGLPAAADTDESSVARTPFILARCQML
mmetsp:Transcript_24364/g.44109  ORF Transcript_24364/g.44109 Transcript_24364/m.44109 type:complete len:211 (-) Transcript_24364:1220-1852(-)